MINDSERITVSVEAGVNADAQATHELTQQLRHHLLASEIGKIEAAPAGVSPAGAKGDPITLASFALAVAPATITSLVTLLQTWLSRHNQASIILESADRKVTVTGNPSKQQQELLDKFLNQRAHDGV